MSRLSSGTTLVHADLHNHTLMSDGAGDPDLAFDSMRSAGLDVAALTDHATVSDHILGDALAGLLPAAYKQIGGITRSDWARTRELADAADADGTFTAIRGFEWSEPLLGHINVWGSEHFTDAGAAVLRHPHLGPPGRRGGHAGRRRAPDGLGGARPWRRHALQPPCNDLGIADTSPWWLQP